MTSRTSNSDLLHPMFIARTSTRSFTNEPVTEPELEVLFEAARWTPSWMNNQPWYFVYSTDGPLRQPILDTLWERNLDWAKNAPVVGLVIAKTELEDFMGRSRDFDVGAAMMALTVQAQLLGLSVHLLGGIDVDAAHTLAGTDDETAKVMCGFVIGHKGDASELSEELQEREIPNPRKTVSEFTFRDKPLS